MLDHVSIQCADVSSSAAFYDAVLSALGGGRIMDFGTVIGYGVGGDPSFWLGPQGDDAPNREVHVAFRATDRAAVRAFFEAARRAGAEVLHEPRRVARVPPGLLRRVRARSRREQRRSRVPPPGVAAGAGPGGSPRPGARYRETVDLCPACDAPNPDGYLFCGRCGAALPADGCPSCGATITAGQRFCGRCGADLNGAAPRAVTTAVEERKLATVLFADVVGFTSLAERTDPEVVARLVDTAFRELGDIVVQHGGTVDKYMGDSVMAVFGVPLAHDDDAERAVAAAMAMRHLGGDLVFSIGVNSGEVMATAVGAGGGVTVIGDTVNVAARLEKAAGPGEVLCGRLTTELTAGRIAYRARQPVLLKGKQEPVEVWEAVSLQPVDLQPGADAPPLVGRDDELAFLEAQWRRVESRPPAPGRRGVRRRRFG